jgi:hypothetical protein
MRWQDLNKKFLMFISAGGILTLAILFSGIDELAGVTVTYHSPDQVCKECLAEIHVNTTYWEICFEHSNRDDIVFKKSSRGRRLWINLNKLVLTDPLIKTEIFVPTYGNNIRLMKDGDCLKRYSQKYFPRVNKLYIYGEPDGEKVKWGVPFLNVDPVWIGWKEVYNNITVPVYSSEVVVVPEIKHPNNTIIKAYNYTNRTVIGYKTVPGKRIGTKIAGKTYPNSIVNNETLIQWDYPVGNRNMDACGGCQCDWWTIPEQGCTEIKFINESK